MKKLSIFAAAAILAGALGAWTEVHADASAASNTVTMKGEVLDLACYLGHGAKGADHATCAKKCLQGGSPAGFLATDGNVYVLVAHDKTLKAVANLGGEMANVTGEKMTKGGLQALVVKKITEAN